MLLSNKKPPPEDSDDGIEHDSPLFKAIMANPTVQLGLNNPRCLLGKFYVKDTFCVLFSQF